MDHRREINSWHHYDGTFETRATGLHGCVTMTAVLLVAPVVVALAVRRRNR
jgi:hypothetical protein